METLGNNLGAITGSKGQKEYYCGSCDFKCFKKYSWSRHIGTSKHMSETFGNCLETQNGQKFKDKLTHLCENCYKEFKTRSGLWKHNKICKIESTNIINTTNKDELIEYLIKENKEIKDLILELAKKDTYNNSIITTNSHNKAFNLNFFLNETCKDAMNIMDFVDSIKLQLSDLENVGKLGYVEGISNIIVKNLNDLDVTERPIHCTDKKREVIYVKDDNKWEKEDEEKKKIKKVIKHVANKNIRLLQKFKEVHPDCGKSTSKFSDQYDKIIVEAMGGSGDNDLEKEEKIIHRISKNVTISKS